MQNTIGLYDTVLHKSSTYSMSAPAINEPGLAERITAPLILLSLCMSEKTVLNSSKTSMFSEFIYNKNISGDLIHTRSKKQKIT